METYQVEPSEHITYVAHGANVVKLSDGEWRIDVLVGPDKIISVKAKEDARKIIREGLSDIVIPSLQASI